MLSIRGFFTQVAYHALSYFTFAVTFLVLLAVGTLYGYYLSHVRRVPITDRRRFLWPFEDEKAEVRREELLYDLNLENHPLGPGHRITQSVQHLLNRLLALEEVRRYRIDSHVYERFSGMLACCRFSDGIFIDTGVILDWATPGQRASILAHEVGHIIPHHITEAESKNFLARYAAYWLGFNSALISTKLALVGEQEFEADHIGFMLMADAGFDPQDFLDWMAREMQIETESLNGRLPLPETRNDHPSWANRIANLRPMLPEARERFENSNLEELDMDDIDWALFREGIVRSKRGRARHKVYGVSPGLSLNRTRTDPEQRRHVPPRPRVNNRECQRAQSTSSK